MEGHCCVVCGRGEWSGLPRGNRGTEVGHGWRLFWPQQCCCQLQPVAQPPELGKLRYSLPLRLKVRLHTATLHF